MKEKKTFGDLLSVSWSEFKENWKTYAVIIFLLSFIPLMIMYVLLFAFGFNIDNLGENFSLFKFFIIMIIVVIFGLLYSWIHSSLIYNSLYKKKMMDVKGSLKGGKKYIWKYIRLTLLIALVFAGVFVVLIIIGLMIYNLLKFNPIAALVFTLLFIFVIIAVILYIIWLGVSWIFSVYVLIGENKGIIDSFKSSKKLVKGKWWITFGYLILMGLIIGVISLIILLPKLIINYTLNPDIFLLTSSIKPDISIATQIVSLIFSFLSNIIVMPLSILFFKNFYLARKNEMKK